MMLDGVTPQWVRWMFARIALRYDLTNTVISAGLDSYWRWCLARRVARYPAQAILDVACGTGSVLLHLMRHCAATIRFVGVDFTAAMVSVGQRRLAQARRRQPWSLCVGDAHALPYADNSFDVVTIVFGVRNFAEPYVSLRECYRVLRAAGWLCVVEFRWPSHYGLGVLYGMYFRYILPLIAWPLTGERTAYRYLRDSVIAFRQQSRLEDLLHQVGFTHVGAEPLSGGITMLYTGCKPSLGSVTEERRYGSRLADDQPGQGGFSRCGDSDESALKRPPSADGRGA